MPRVEKVIAVFLASPSDVSEERQVLSSVVDELNLAWSSRLGARLELQRWETHAFPAVGIDAQAVINDQIKDRYDIFVGVMWGRFGTPTGRAGSGTEEEFARAMERRSLGEDVRVMIYFKDSPLSPSEIDPEQLSRVHQFKRGLAARGVLHWSFKTSDEFTSLARMHLTKQLLEFTAEGPGGSPTSLGPESFHSLIAAGSKTAAEEDEAGLLELSEQLEQHLAIATDAGTRVAEVMNRLREETVAHTSAFETLASDPNASREDFKRAINASAESMERATTEMRAELPKLESSLLAAMTAVASIAMMGDSMAEEEHQDARNSVIGFREGMNGAIAGTRAMRDATSRLPRLTSRLNRSRRALVSVLDDTISAFEQGDRLAAEAEVLFEKHPRFMAS